jgi:hypothetical protein
MYEKFAETQLKTGETLEVGAIIAPDDAHAEEIKPFLGHKPGAFKWHIERSVVEPLDALETRFYVGKLNGKIVANIMTVEHRGVGILGHVFTTPEQRRKGACTAVMGPQMEDFRRRNGEALYLGTGYNSPPYHIYKSFGFESVYPESGFMRYYTSVDFETRYFASGDVRVKSVEWRDWPKLTALTGLVEGDYLRSIRFSVYGPTNFEGGFLGFKRELESGESYHDAKLLETDSGAIVAIATVTWDNRWRPRTAVLDVFAHPNFWKAASALLNAIKPPDAKIQCYVESGASGKTALLENAGFHCEATLKGQILRRGESTDVLIFSRR